MTNLQKEGMVLSSIWEALEKDLLYYLSQQS